MTDSSSDNGIYYFLGNITSHILHALPLYKELGGTFVVLSDKAKHELEAYDVPVINIDNKPRLWTRFGYKLKPIYQYTEIGPNLKRTTDYLNQHAKVVIFYELYDFDESARLTKPKTVFLTHGNMLKDYMNQNNRLRTLDQYDYMAALGPYLKKQFIEKDDINPNKLIDIGLARTDEIVKNKGEVVVSKDLIEETSIDPAKKVVAYMPTFWGASSIYTTGKEIIRNFPDNYTLLFRPHPQTPQKLLNEYLKIIKTKPGNIVYAPEGRFKSLGLIDIYNASSIIIGDVSSVMLDAILTNKPLIFAYDKGTNRQPESNYSSIIDVLSKSEKINPENAHLLEDILARSIDNGIDEKIWQDAAQYNFYNTDGTSVESIKKCIKELL